MSDETKFLGLRTVVYHVADLAEATKWYSTILRVGPYFDQPFYVGFNVGGFELGLHPLESEAQAAGKAVAYWGVPDVEATLIWLLDNGATVDEEIQEVGGGIKVATVCDPFGNRLGIIENPGFPNDAQPITNGT